MEGQNTKAITILGAGAWGTALAIHLAKLGQKVKLWSYEIPEVASMLAERCNDRYLPGFPFPDEILPTANLADAVKDTQDIVVAVPSIGFRDTLTMLKPLINDEHRIICVSKGLDVDTGMLLHEVARETLGEKQLFAALSGPSFAREVAKGQPTSVVIASKDAAFTASVMQRFKSDSFFTFASDDVVGVEIGGVVKNVIAIATGIFDGMSFGANARSALLTFGLAEMASLSKALGGRAETVNGLSGMGDLLLTATDDQSRNRRFGLALGQGKDIEDAEKEIGHVVEGKRNAELIDKLAKKHQVKMPICETMWSLLQGQTPIKEAVATMLAWEG